jgi:hypothetical protein
MLRGALAVLQAPVLDGLYAQWPFRVLVTRGHRFVATARSELGRAQPCCFGGHPQPIPVGKE